MSCTRAGLCVPARCQCRPKPGSGTVLVIASIASWRGGHGGGVGWPAGVSGGPRAIEVTVLEGRGPAMDDRTAGGAGDPGARPESPRAGPAAGELVTETLDYDGGRQVTVYVPPDPPRAVVFAGDGQGVPRWGGALEAAGVLPVMIVGVHGLADETLRLQEYSPVFDSEQFTAHERFFVGDVGRWARSRFGVALPAGRTAVFGVSAGGELALALGLRHPDVYGAILDR